MKSHSLPHNTIDAAALHDQLSPTNPPHLIDVRTPAEFETQHISGAYNVPLDPLREHRDDIASHLDQPVVLICRSGQCAAQAEVSLREAELTNVWILDGGMSGWQAGGFSPSRGRQRWELERQVRLIAGMIVALSVLASAFIPYIEWVAFAIGAGLTIAALTNTCAMGMLLAQLPLQPRWHHRRRQGHRQLTGCPHRWPPGDTAADTTAHHTSIPAAASGISMAAVSLTRDEGYPLG